MRAVLFSTFALIISAVAVFPFAGNAAPQILGLVATAAPLPMHCAEGVCSVEVSGVCLQENRMAPAAGTAYKAAKGSDLTLVVQNRDGVQQTLAVTDLADIRSLRLFNSVKVSLPEHVIRQFGGDGVQASLSVGPMVSAVPVPVAGDDNPLTAEEIREYTGSLRAAAEHAIGRDEANLTATRVLNRMVNWLPENTPYGTEQIAAVRNGAMSPLIAAEQPAAIRLVDRALDECRHKVRVKAMPHLRFCIANQHDILNSETTQTVWRSLRPGS